MLSAMSFDPVGYKSSTRDQWEQDQVDCCPKGQAERSTRHRTIDGRTAFQFEERKDLGNAK